MTPCESIERGTAHIVDISNYILECFKDFTKFKDTYGSTTSGMAIKFQKKKNSLDWTKVKTNDSAWTVAKWIDWFEKAKDLTQHTEAYYLVDVPLLNFHEEELRRHPVVDAFSHRGKYCLTQYLNK